MLQTVGNYIHENDDAGQISKLQDALTIIHRVLGTYGHYYGIEILESVIRLEESGLSVSEREYINSRFEKWRDITREWIKRFSVLERERNEILPSLNESESKELHNQINIVMKWFQNNPAIEIDSKQFMEYQNCDEEFSKFKNLYFDAPFEKRAYMERFPYSKEYVTLLADYLTFTLFVARLRRMTR